MARGDEPSGAVTPAGRPGPGPPGADSPGPKTPRATESFPTEGIPSSPYSRHKAEVELSFTAQEDLLKKITAALIARRVPDVAFCFYNDWQVVPKYGWSDQLADQCGEWPAVRGRLA